MTTPADSPRRDLIFGEDAHRRAFAAMHAVADGLTAQSMDVLGQEWDEAHYLKVTNMWGALCEATVGASGVFTWEYRPAEVAWAEPGQVTGMALALLGADVTAGEPGEPPARYPGQTLRSAAGLAARARGMRVALTAVFGDADFLEVSADLQITNPARPERGRVCFDGSSLRWECRIASPDAGAAGLEIAEITKTIGCSVPQLQVINAERRGPDA